MNGRKIQADADFASFLLKEASGLPRLADANTVLRSHALTGKGSSTLWSGRRPFRFVEIASRAAF